MTEDRTHEKAVKSYMVEDSITKNFICRICKKKYVHEKTCFNHIAKEHQEIVVKKQIGIQIEEKERAKEFWTKEALVQALDRLFY